jgi:hypothetical protein
MQNTIKDAQPKEPDPKKTSVHHRDNQAPSELEHVDPPPRDVREAPVPNPNGDKKS